MHPHLMIRLIFPHRFVGLAKTPLRTQLRTISRSYTSNAAAPKKPTGLKALMKEYGYSALGVYFGLSMIDLPLCYLLVHSLGKDEIERYENDAKQYFGYGVDPAELELRQQVRKLSSEVDRDSSEGGWLAQFSWTEFALAYGIHKSLIFIRVPICAAITPGVVALLRRWGFRIGSANLSTNALIAKDKIQDMTASSSRFGVRPNAKKRWFSWFF